ncbi:hypothetical protein DPMN_157755 [Dreissena polymorpha]|uniref:Uncharacterized protein n=1 Tax=Dreissena polymorpha TaxID=45954 RepID=A0A9D4ILC0_DREPO|nr:hypothetical protein DPMN_157755 [Dreissena polymorpha]
MIHRSSQAVDERIRKVRSSVFSLMTIKETTYDIYPLKMADLMEKDINPHSSVRIGTLVITDER